MTAFPHRGKAERELPRRKTGLAAVSYTHLDMSELFLKIVNMSISASWIVVAVLALRFCLKKAPKWVNVLLWGIVAVRMVFPFSDRKSTRLNSSHSGESRMPSSA